MDEWLVHSTSVAPRKNAAQTGIMRGPRVTVNSVHFYGERDTQMSGMNREQARPEINNQASYENPAYIYCKDYTAISSTGVY